MRVLDALSDSLFTDSRCPFGPMETAPGTIAPGAWLLKMPPGQGKPNMPLGQLPLGQLTQGQLSIDYCNKWPWDNFESNLTQG